MTELLNTVVPDMQLDINEPVVIHTGTCSTKTALGRVFVQTESTDRNLPHAVLTGHFSPHRARTLAFDLLDAADEAELAAQEKARDDLAWASYHAYPQRVVLGFDGTHNDELDTYSLAFSRPPWCAEPETTELAPVSLATAVRDWYFETTIDNVSPVLIDLLYGPLPGVRNPTEPRDDWFRHTANNATD